jgi:hypothetical protein
MACSATHASSRQAAMPHRAGSNLVTIAQTSNFTSFFARLPSKKWVGSSILNKGQSAKVMQSAKDRVGMDTSSSLNWARERRVLI